MTRELTQEEEATKVETHKHISNVKKLLAVVGKELHLRSLLHDESKTELPEVEVFTKYTHLLADCTYGSDEYKKYLTEMKEGALDHHYANNRHHPEFFENGTNGMNLIDLMEMICDWKAATLRHKDGDIKKSLEFNKRRFSITPELQDVLVNTVRDLGWE